MTQTGTFTELQGRARDVFRQLVETYVTTGEPVGSRSLSRHINASPATIRNDMADLEDLGLLMSPHTSAGRLPTDLGMRYFVDGILESGMLGLSEAERETIEQECGRDGMNMSELFEQAGTVLSGLSSSAGLVVAPKADKSIRQIEFVSLDPSRALVVIIPEDGLVENRIMDLPPGITVEMLKRAGNFLSERLYGRTIGGMRDAITKEIKTRQAELGDLTTKVIEAGLATELSDGKLIVRGSAHLLQQESINDLDRIKTLIDQLEDKKTVSELLDEASKGSGVKIYIGSENRIFKDTGHSLILAPYNSGSNHVVGAIGVIGPTRLDYAKIIPSINYMAEVISRKLHTFSQG